MLNFQLVTEEDRKQQAAILRKRALEEERRKRIFNPRQRLFGIDYETLQKQIEEKKQRQASEKANDELFDLQLIKRDQTAVELERKERQERLRIEKEINDFRKFYQRPQDRREFDLNDPKQIKKGLVDNNECGLSAAQKFEGEDTVSDQRAKVQKEQLKAWLDQQLKEKEVMNKEQTEMEMAYNAATISNDQKALQLDNLEKQCRKKMEEACLRFNTALAQEKKNEVLKEQHQTLRDNLAEMYNFITSDMLTENPDVSKSPLGGNRRIGYLYKGMTPEEREAVRKFQLQQVEEAKIRREMEKQVQRDFDEYMNRTQDIVLLKEKDMEKKLRELNKEIQAENQKLAKEQKRYKEFLKKTVYTNSLTEEYYEQFNKTTR